MGLTNIVLSQDIDEELSFNLFSSGRFCRNWSLHLMRHSQKTAYTSPLFLLVFFTKASPVIYQGVETEEIEDDDVSRLESQDFLHIIRQGKYISLFYSLLICFCYRLCNKLSMARKIRHMHAIYSTHLPVASSAVVFFKPEIKYCEILQLLVKERTIRGLVERVMPARRSQV